MSQHPAWDKRLQLCPSLLSANFMQFGQEIAEIEGAASTGFILMSWTDTLFLT